MTKKWLCDSDAQPELQSALCEACNGPLRIVDLERSSGRRTAAERYEKSRILHARHDRMGGRSIACWCRDESRHGRQECLRHNVVMMADERVDEQIPDSRRNLFRTAIHTDNRVNLVFGGQLQPALQLLGDFMLFEIVLALRDALRCVVEQDPRLRPRRKISITSSCRGETSGQSDRDRQSCRARNDRRRSCARHVRRNPGRGCGPSTRTQEGNPGSNSRGEANAIFPGYGADDYCRWGPPAFQPARLTTAESPDAIAGP